jgi:hypothetical protein
LRVAIAQVADVHDPRDWIGEYCALRASLNTKAAAIAFFSVYSDNSKFLVPREGISVANRDTILALVADERSVYTLFLPRQDFDPGPPRIELLFMKKDANLFAHSTAATFLMVNTNLETALDCSHFGTSISNLLGEPYSIPLSMSRRKKR